MTRVGTERGDRHEGRREIDANDLARTRRHERRHHRPDQAPAPVRDRAIETMQVRGAPLIGAAAAYGICLALCADASDASLERAYARLLATRPTAINLKWALDEMLAAVRNRPREGRVATACRRAGEI